MDEEKLKTAKKSFINQIKIFTEENQSDIKKLSTWELHFVDDATYNVKTGKFTHNIRSNAYIFGPQETVTAFNEKVDIWNKNQCWPWPTVYKLRGE